MDNIQYINTLAGLISTILNSTKAPARDMDFGFVVETCESMEKCRAELMDTWKILEVEKQDGTHIYYAVEFLDDCIRYMAQRAKELQGCIEESKPALAEKG